MERRIATWMVFLFGRSTRKCDFFRRWVRTLKPFERRVSSQIDGSGVDKEIYARLVWSLNMNNRMSKTQPFYSMGIYPLDFLNNRFARSYFLTSRLLRNTKTQNRTD